MTATSASGWETTSTDRVERGKFRIRVPSNPLLKEREGAQHKPTRSPLANHYNTRCGTAETTT
jgi:hypothetical protein